MAAQNQMYPTNAGAPGDLLHFWNQTTSAFAKIVIIYSRGPSYSYEDVVWHGWGEICALYFTKVAATPTGPRWAIDREAYRGFQDLNPSQIKPDLIAVEMAPAPVPLGQMPPVSSRDILWIECKPANADTPSHWRKVLNEAVNRLKVAHSNRVVYLLIAVGWKCMYFKWDPIGATASPRKLYIRSSTKTSRWYIDESIKVIHTVPWVDTGTGEIHVESAMELDCWTMTLVNGQNVLRNRQSLGMIESFLIKIRDGALQGLNPETF